MDTQAVREIQEALRYLSFYDPRLMPVTVDGIYSSQTTDAVRIFQTLNDLEPTGNVDRATWEELRDSIADLRNQKPFSVDIFPYPDYHLQPNTATRTVAFIQLMLQELSDYYKNIHYVEATGIYDENTVEQIRTIQSLHRLEPNGVLNTDTWDVLATLFQNRFDTVKR